jgi:hypothetical protein
MITKVSRDRCLTYECHLSLDIFLSLTSWTDFLRPFGSKRLKSSGKPLFPQEPQSPQGLAARQRMLFPICHTLPHFGIHLLVVVVQSYLHSLSVFRICEGKITNNIRNHQNSNQKLVKERRYYCFLLFHWANH